MNTASVHPSDWLWKEGGGLNWIMQRMSDLRTLQVHLVYDRAVLVAVHEAAGLRTIASGYAGFFDAHLSSAAGSSSRLRQRLHRRACRALGRCAEAWTRLGGGRGTPEMRFIAPHVYCVGRRDPSPAAGGPQ